MAREPKTKGEQQSLLLRFVLAAERDGDLRRAAFHAYSARLASRVAAGAGVVLALTAISSTDQQLANMLLLWVVFVLLLCRTLDKAAFTAQSGRSKWLGAIAARSLLTATLVVLVSVAWRVSTLPVSLVGSAAVLQAYGHLAFVQVRRTVVAVQGDDPSRPV